MILGVWNAMVIPMKKDYYILYSKIFHENEIFLGKIVDIQKKFYICKIVNLYVVLKFKLCL